MKLTINLDPDLVAAWLDENTSTFVDQEFDIIDGNFTDVINAVFHTLEAHSDDAIISESGR